MKYKVHDPSGAAPYSRVAGRGRPTGTSRIKTSTITVLFHISRLELQPGDHTNIVKTVRYLHFNLTFSIDNLVNTSRYLSAYI